MKSLSLLLFFALVPLAFESTAQFPDKRVDCKSVAKLTAPINLRIVSMGVLNGRAETLPRPSYPAAGRAVGARGSVVVTIKIDPRGCVSEANVVSGHPLLLKGSVDAALSSTFKPTTLSGTPVWVTGIITYNYAGDQYNWLELGFRSATADIAADLPDGFSFFRERLAEYDLERDGSKRTWNAKTYDQINVELAVDPKKQWLFVMGRKLAAVKTYDYIGMDGRTKLLSEITEMTKTAPDSISGQLLSRLLKLPAARELWTELRELEIRLYALGL